MTSKIVSEVIDTDFETLKPGDKISLWVGGVWTTDVVRSVVKMETLSYPRPSVKVSIEKMQDWITQNIWNARGGVVMSRVPRLAENTAYSNMAKLLDMNVVRFVSEVATRAKNAISWSENNRVASAKDELAAIVRMCDGYKTPVDTRPHYMGWPDNLTPDRECFEVFYQYMANRAMGKDSVTADSLRAMRTGETYGDRPFLNAQWEAWPYVVIYARKGMFTYLNNTNEQRLNEYFDFWCENTRDEGSPPSPRFAQWFGDDEIDAGQAKSICMQRGIEITFWSDDMPECMADNDEELSARHLDMIGRPKFHDTDGWRLVQATDTEDGEICLMYARQIKVGFV